MSTKTKEGMARSSFSTPAFAQLVKRLRHTNARYEQIAHHFRCRIRPTHHAKRRAYRSGLRIDIYKARALAAGQVSSNTPHTLARTGVPPTPVDAPTNAHTASGGMTAHGEHGARQGDAYMREVSLRNLPEVVVRKPSRRSGRKRNTILLPPLRISSDAGDGNAAPFEGPMPGAPRLLPRQLPDEGGVEEMTLGSALSAPLFMESSLNSLSDPSPHDVRTYSGLCITIPPRGVKRKLQDGEDGEDTALSPPKRILMARWNESRRQ